MIEVMIGEHHVLVRSGIKRMLADERDIAVAAEAGRVEAVIAAAKRGRFGVALMDVELPGMDCLEATRRLLRIDASLRIVFMSARAAGPYPVNLMKAGASGYLTQASSGEELVACIRRVHRGERFLSADVAQSVLLSHLDADDSPLGGLTPRELSVLVMLSKGHQRLEISDKLCVSPKTISTYRTRLLRKLGARSDVELTHLSLRHGLITSGEALPGG